MKSLIIFPALFFLFSFTQPFAQQGSVDNDSELLEERMEKAQKNRIQEKRAKEAVTEGRQREEELDQNLKPHILLKDKKKIKGDL